MQNYNELINNLSELCGIVPEYWDIFGSRHLTSTETKKAVLKAMGLNINSEEEILAEINRRNDRPWNRFIEPVKVISVNEQPVTIPVYFPAGEGDEGGISISWSVEDEDGHKDEGKLSGSGISASGQKWLNGVRHISVDLKDCRDRDIGYYTVSVLCSCRGNVFQGSCRLIVAPDESYVHPDLADGKSWGLALNLYSIRSDSNWGVGDFGDLEKIVRWASGMQCGFIGINPLHAIANKKPSGISPYSPISRLYKNFIYLDLESIPEVVESEKAQAIITSGDFARDLENAKSADLIDYEKISSIKLGVLRPAFDYFYSLDSGSPRTLEFKQYEIEEGETLESFATYMALAYRFAPDSPGFNWRDWPEDFLDPSGHAVQEFRKTNRKEILFHKYVQWLIDRQLRGIAELASGLGMPLGLYHDLAIGSIGGGSDAWNYRGVITHGIDVGAPPDDFNITGQNWGFPPTVPERLKETGYEFFIQTIRRNMKYGGALRIDHALGMFRLFWIPEGMPAAQGAYVRSPSEDFLRIIALESLRNRTMVIAEDLGTIGENVRETLQRFKMLSYRLLYFERNYPDPSFSAPEKYPSMALCSVTTHDLPTIYGYWSGRDIELKERLGLYHDGNVRERHIAERERDKKLLLNALRAAGVIDDQGHENEMTPELCLAIYEYLARSCCKMITISLDDAIGTHDQQNMPGITDQYPSWMQRTPVALEQIISGKWFSYFSERLRKDASVSKRY